VDDEADWFFYPVQEVSTGILPHFIALAETIENIKGFQREGKRMIGASVSRVRNPGILFFI
jgi:hypothetical protein